MLPESLRQQLTVAKQTQRLHARRTQRERSRATWGPHHCGAQRSLATRHPAQHCAQQHSALMQSVGHSSIRVPCRPPRIGVPTGCWKATRSRPTSCRPCTFGKEQLLP